MSATIARLRWDESVPELLEVFPFRHELVHDARRERARDLRRADRRCMAAAVAPGAAHPNRVMHPIAGCEISASAMKIRVVYGEDSHLAREAVLGVLAAELRTTQPDVGVVILSQGAIAEHVVITKRAVERHINAIFAKLGLADSEHFSRRVKAALLYLAGQAG